MVEVLRETKNAINARLDMLEMMIVKSTHVNEYNDQNSLHNFMKDSNNRFEEIETMLYRFNDTINIIKTHIEEQQISDILPRTIIIDKEDNTNISELAFDGTVPDMIIVDKEEEEEEEEDIIDNKVVNLDEDVVSTSVLPEEEEQEEEAEDAEEQEEAEDAEEEAEQEEAEQEEEEAEQEAEEEEQEEEDAEEGIELTEFEYKGMTLYHDSDMKVYRMDDDGALSDVLGIYHPHPTNRELDKIKKV